MCGAQVMARKEPRKLLVQPVMAVSTDGARQTPHTAHAPAPCTFARSSAERLCTVRGAGTHSIAQYEESATGMVRSFVERFPAEDAELMALYEQDKPLVLD